MRPDGMRMGLAATQDALMELITGRDVGNGPYAPETVVVGDSRADAADRIHVYAHMYRARLVEAMESQFPRLARHLGTHEFTDLVLSYVAVEPSRNPSLRFIGRRFPAWLEPKCPDRPWLSDLARLEWARADVFDAADESVLSLDALRALAPEEFATLPLQLIRARRVVIADYAIGDFWARIGGGSDESDEDNHGDAGTDARPTGRPVEAPMDSEDESGEAMLVWRQGTAVYHRPIAGREWDALEQVATGTTFGAICEWLLAFLAPEQATTQAFTWLCNWASDGLLARDDA